MRPDDMRGGASDRNAGLLVQFVRLPDGGVACFGQDVAVAVAQVQRDPLVLDGAVDAALEIAVTHCEEMIAAQHAAGRNAMLREGAKNLAACFFVGERASHCLHPFGFCELETATPLDA